MMSLLTVGTVAFDTIETPYGKAEMVIGGACTYISWSASYFTNHIHLVSIVGDDFPDHELQKLKNRGVSMDGLKIVEGGKSFFWAGRYHNKMNNRDTLITDLNVLAEFDPKLPDGAKSSKYVMLGNLTPAIQKSVLDQLDGSQKLIALDTMNFWMDIALDSLKEVMKKVDVITINDEEARQLSGEYSLVKAARKILTMGPKYVVIKKGEHGALLFDKEHMFFAPALPLEEVMDPTGAGDTFAGGFIGFIAHTKDISFENMKRAIIIGSSLASFTVEKFGTERILDLKESEIDARIQSFVELVDFNIEFVE
ncbi:MAG TPA: sugar kinase [Flavobacteriales bacterium]|nr:sugar kinase [Flavobacteriales bacterium]